MPFQSLCKRLALGILATTSLAAQAPSHAAGTQGLSAVDVNASQFAIVAAPIPGSGTSQLQIYEQIGSQRACYAVNGDTVDPLLVSFDFTNICQRYIDSNGYSLRIGSQDLGTIYRLSIRRSGSEHVLMAIPTKPGAGPELRVARAIGDGAGFLKLELGPGWRLMRRQFGGRSLGHVYVYSDAAPSAAAQPAAAPVAAPAGMPSAMPGMPAAKPAMPGMPGMPAAKPPAGQSASPAAPAPATAAPAAPAAR